MNRCGNINFSPKNLFNWEINILLIDKYALSLPSAHMLRLKWWIIIKIQSAVNIIFKFFSCGLCTMAINVFTWRITTNRVHLYINHYNGYVALPEVVLTCLRNTSDITVAVSLWLSVSLWRRSMAAEPRVMTSQEHLKRYDANHYSIEMRNKRKIKHWIDVET